MGRPPVGTKRGPSPVVRARVPQALKDRLHALAERENRDESDIVREALAAYVKVRQVS
ncbi:ribbon-helix-helix protein, CopG family [Labedella populi]|uniref:Ribbon-helix-helix protein, CopG family n=2 Tax=Labedella populi TaxID=2498850 RepID=A0A3S3ZZY6_9MICO|nr:ribbon-helix-helix protein, CopG family [Labedella populi]